MKRHTGLWLSTDLCHASDDSRSFLVVGDWGGISFHPYTTPVQTAVADEMAVMASRDGADFVVTLGDNFYLYGVQDVDDTRFKVLATQRMLRFVILILMNTICNVGFDENMF